MWPIFLVILQLALLINAKEDPLLVNITNGALRGRYSFTKNGRQILSFTAIPYAEPPLGKLRFEPPVPAGKWEGVYNATKGHVGCIQRDIFARLSAITGDENCLFLNVYTPDLSGCFPVMMFIHGGAWTMGSGRPGIFVPDVLLNQDVVLVVPNYRLGALGMLSTGDRVVPGNNGLKDQALVLKWINENIAQFGGDPTRVTVFGESAGGASAHFFMFSPLTKGLFHRAMAQSGTALCPWALSINGTTERRSRKLAALFNCTTSDSQEMVECLRNIPAKSIVATDAAFFEWDKDPLVNFRPVIEVEHSGAFLCEHPVDLLVKRKFNDVPLVIGMTTEDGALKTSPLFGVPHLLEEYNQNLVDKIRITLIFEDHSLDPNNIANKIRNFYYGDHEVTESLINNVTKLYTDGYFLSGINEVIYFHKAYSKENVYQYLFGYKGATSWSEILGDTVPRDLGVCHGDTQNFLFPIQENLFGRTVSAIETQMRNVMTTLWMNFASCGNPTPTDEVCRWLPVKSPDCSEYLLIKAPNNLRMEKGIYQDRADFWRSLALDEKINSVKL